VQVFGKLHAYPWDIWCIVSTWSTC
jgi:hypothetical protein